MSAMYEFHVTGLIGPVVEAALPELTTQAAPKHSVLTGSVSESRDVQALLDKLTDHGLVADHIVLAACTRWRDTSPPDGTEFVAGDQSDPTEEGPQVSTEERVWPHLPDTLYSAPRQS